MPCWVVTIQRISSRMGLTFSSIKKHGKFWNLTLLQSSQISSTQGNYQRGSTSFLVLIPKVPGTSSLTKFWPISLINGIYKLISKVLSIRLRSVLPSIIYDNQQAFVKGRSILECSLIASDVINILEKWREKALLLKLDFHKAFDYLSWDFLSSTMACMGFNQTWIN